MKRLLAVLTAISLAVSCVPGAKAGNTKEAAGYIALTFDDGPSGAITETLLDGLAARNVKATFFLCGYRIETFPEIAQRMAEEGHELGLHSNRHGYMQHMTKEEALDDLSSARASSPRRPAFPRACSARRAGFTRRTCWMLRASSGLASCSGRSTRTIGTKRNPRRCCRICSRMRRQGISS